MGMFDIFSDDKKKHEKAYGRGVNDSQNASVYDKALHGLDDFIGDFCGKGTKEHQSYEAGYHSGEKRRSRKISVSGSGTENFGTEMLFKLGIVVLLFFGGLAITKRPVTSPRSNVSGTVRQINANELNLRSGPGKDYPILRVFTRGEELVSFDELQKADGYIWVRVQTLNGQTQGWIVRKYLSQ